MSIPIVIYVLCAQREYEKAASELLLIPFFPAIGFESFCKYEIFPRTMVPSYQRHC